MNDGTATAATSGERRRRHTVGARSQRPQRSSSWLRSLYFSLAALWGYAIGVGVLLIALRAAGSELQLGPSGLAMIFPGALVALIGAWVSAAAYRQSRRRLR